MASAGAKRFSAGGGGDNTPSKVQAAGGRESSPPPPYSLGDKKTDTPSFSVKKWITSNWREAIDIADDEDDFPTQFPTSEGGTPLRIYDLAVKKHQEVPGCGKGGVKPTCVYCVAQGGQNPWKGDPLKKMVSLNLYVEVMKNYVPVDADYVASFPDEIEAFKDISQLDVNDYFFDRCFPMLYCSQCYPDLPNAVERMDTLQAFNLPYERGTGADFFALRQKQISDLRSYKETKKAEFSVALRQISLTSELDWRFHLHSAKHQHKEAPKAVGLEILDVKGSLEAVKQQIVSLELRMNASAGKNAEVFAARLLETEKMRGLFTKSTRCLEFMTSVSQSSKKTDLEEVVEACFEKVLNEKAGGVIARQIVQQQSFADFLRVSNEHYRYMSAEHDDGGGQKTTDFEENMKAIFRDILVEFGKEIEQRGDAFHEGLEKVIEGTIEAKLAEFKTSVIDVKFQAVLDALAVIDAKIGQ